MTPSIRLTLEIARRVAEHYSQEGTETSPALCAVAAQEYVRTLQGRSEQDTVLPAVDPDQLISWVGRYAKALGEFYFNEREG